VVPVQIPPDCPQTVSSFPGFLKTVPLFSIRSVTSFLKQSFNVPGLTPALPYAVGFLNGEQVIACQTFVLTGYPQRPGADRFLTTTYCGCLSEADSPFSGVSLMVNASVALGLSASSLPSATLLYMAVVQQTTDCSWCKPVSTPKLAYRSVHEIDIQIMWRRTHAWPRFAMGAIFKGRIHRKMRDVCATHPKRWVHSIPGQHTTFS